MGINAQTFWFTDPSQPSSTPVSDLGEYIYTQLRTLLSPFPVGDQGSQPEIIFAVC